MQRSQVKVIHSKRLYRSKIEISFIKGRSRSLQSTNRTKSYKGITSLRLNRRPMTCPWYLLDLQRNPLLIFGGYTDKSNIKKCTWLPVVVRTSPTSRRARDLNRHGDLALCSDQRSVPGHPHSSHFLLFEPLGRPRWPAHNGLREEEGLPGLLQTGSSRDHPKEEQGFRQVEEQKAHQMGGNKLAIGHAMQPPGHSIPRQGRTDPSQGALLPRCTLKPAHLRWSLRHGWTSWLRPSPPKLETQRSPKLQLSLPGLALPSAMGPPHGT